MAASAALAALANGVLAERGRYRALLAGDATGRARAQDLRGRCFGLPGPDRDSHDAACLHVLVEQWQTGRVVACFRLCLLDGQADLASCYSAQFYDLQALGAHPARLAELGRFCVAPDGLDPDVLRLAWGALAVLVDRHGIDRLFGCASFSGTDPMAHAQAFAQLRAAHLMPSGQTPRPRALERFDYVLADLPPLDPRAALRQMPPLLRSYLALGARVGDHAVIDRQLGTLHVFTALDIAAIPPARARALRAVAG